jgi:hypothetical protein
MRYSTTIHMKNGETITYPTAAPFDSEALKATWITIVSDNGDRTSIAVDDISFVECRNK